MIAIIQYNAGNTRSVYNALQRLGVEATITDNPEHIRRAQKVIFPGVGHAASAMEQLKRSGLHELIPQLQQPFLGICLGMQLLCSYSQEGATPGLGIFPARVLRFPVAMRVPHMGWNTTRREVSALFRGIDADSYFYFVHSYYAETCDATLATTNHGLPFSAALQRRNFFGVQFHPEKSAAAGARLLQNFLEL